MIDGREVFIGWSGGKDSTATALLAKRLGIEVDALVFTEIMFDNERGISGEQPEHIQWMYDYAKPYMESLGFKVIVLRAKQDFVSVYKHVVTKSKVATRIGKMIGFPLQGKCAISRDLKLKPMNEFRKQHKGAVWLLGIAVDEPERVARIKPPNRSLLAETGKRQKDAYDICKEANMLSPVYKDYSHGGNCWFCPNGNVRQFAMLKRYHPELWEELCLLPKDNLVKDSFGFQGTFEQFKTKVESYKLMKPRDLIPR